MVLLCSKLRPGPSDLRIRYPWKRRPPGLKIAHAELRGQIAQKHQVLTRVENRLRHTPSQISAQQAGKTRALLHEDRRLLVNALKLTAANAERMLALHFDRFYQNPKDAFSIFRGLLQLPGVVRSAGPDRLEVLLQRPDSPKVAEALALLLVDLNHQTTPDARRRPRPYLPPARR